MKTLSALLFTLLACLSISPSHAFAYETHGQNHFNQNDFHNQRPRQIFIRHSDYLIFEGDYDIDCEYGHLGKIVRSTFSIPSTFTFFNSLGHPSATAHTHFHTWDFHFKPVSYMDIYNEFGQFLGIIDSSFIGRQAEYFFYDAYEHLVGIARGDYDRCRYVIYHPYDANRIIATMNRGSVGSITDSWMIEIVDPYAIDTTILLYFGALASHTLAH